jgi:CheY-like chemotaxis protein
MGQTASQRTILVAEDEPFIRISAGAGFGVLNAKDSAEALGMLARHIDVSVLCTDVRMPGLRDGLAQVAHVCIASICSLVVSGNASSMLARNAGASGLVAKSSTVRKIVQAEHEHWSAELTISR